MKTYSLLLSLLTLAIVFFAATVTAFSETAFGETVADEVIYKFSDIEGHSEEEIILKWAVSGAIKGEGGAFRPEDPVTRAELAVIINNIMKFEKKSENLFRDIEIGSWYEDAFLRVNAAGIIFGYETGHAYPHACIPYSQAAEIIAKAFGVDFNTLINNGIKDREFTDCLSRAQAISLIDKAENIRMMIIEDNNSNDYDPTVTGPAIIAEKAEKVPVLMYHHILPQADIEKYGWSGNNSVVSLEDFKQQMSYLHENNFHTATLDELKDFLDNKTDLPKDTVIITFDDGYLSNAVYAYPVMKEYGFKGTIFIIGNSSFEVNKTFMPDVLQHISAAEFGKYKDVFDYGSHTYNMHRKTDNKSLLTASETEKVYEDLNQNMKIVTGKYFSYPYGIYNNRTINILKDLGYSLAFTVNRSLVTNESNRYILPRIGIFQSLSMDDFRKILSDQNPGGKDR